MDFVELCYGLFIPFWVYRYQMPYIRGETNRAQTFQETPLFSKQLHKINSQLKLGLTVMKPFFLWLILQKYHNIFAIYQFAPPHYGVENFGPYRPCPNNTLCSLGFVCLFWSTHPHYGVCIIPCLSPDCVHSVHPCLPCLETSFQSDSGSVRFLFGSRKAPCCIRCLHSGHHC